MNPVTKEQYEFFRSLYEEEAKTSATLEGRAKVYLGIISAFLAALVLKASDAKSVAEALHIRWGWMLLEALPMTMGLLLTLWALRIRHFEVVNDGPLLINTYGGNWPAAGDFFQDRVVDYAIASAINKRINNEAAVTLEWAGWCLAGGVIYLLGVVIYAVGRS